MNKRDYDEMLVVYKDQILLLKDNVKDLKEQNQKLSDQVFRLQDGIMAVRAPEAYRDYRTDMTPVAEMSGEEKEKLQLRSDLTRAYLSNIEAPLFKSATDMEEILAPTLFGSIQESESLHENDES